MERRKKISRGIALFVLFLVVVTMVSADMGPRPVTIYTPAGQVKVLTAHFSVQEVLAAAGIIPDGDNERVYPGLEEVCVDNIVITRSLEVTLLADGREWQVATWAGTVAGLLAELGLEREGDLLSCPPEQELTQGLRVELVRLETELIQEEVSIPANTVYQDDATLAQGKSKVKTPALAGKKLVVREVIRRDGREVTRRLVGETILQAPVTGIVLRGTKTISRSAGSEAIEGLASYYGAELHGRKTASGVPFDMNALTAAHKTLPFGTRVKVTFLATGKSVIVEINDRGPFIPGRIIDLSAAAAKVIGLYAAGVGKVRLEIIQ